MIAFGPPLKPRLLTTYALNKSCGRPFTPQLYKKQSLCINTGVLRIENLSTGWIRGCVGSVVVLWPHLERPSWQEVLGEDAEEETRTRCVAGQDADSAVRTHAGG
jgi:hypothetical protein